VPVLKAIYIVFIGILLATFIGVGIAAFHQGPKEPERPPLIEYCSPEATRDTLAYEDFKIEQEKFDAEMNVFQEQAKIYNRNVSLISLTAAIIILILSLTLFNKIYLIADGLLLGSVLTLVYSIIRGFSSQDEMFRFAVVTVSLVLALTLGYLKFIKPSKKKRVDIKN